MTERQEEHVVRVTEAALEAMGNVNPVEQCDVCGVWDAAIDVVHFTDPTQGDASLAVCGGCRRHAVGADDD